MAHSGKSFVRKRYHYLTNCKLDPLYREKYVQNLKREFPQIPFFKDFWQWAAWGEALMLHIGYEAVTPFALKRADVPDARARTAGLQPKAMLRAEPDVGGITLDSETTLRGIPPLAWAYKLGNRSALEWVLDQYKEKVIDLLARVTTVSVETMQVVDAMLAASR